MSFKMEGPTCQNDLEVEQNILELEQQILKMLYHTSQAILHQRSEHHCTYEYPSAVLSRNK